MIEVIKELIGVVRGPIETVNTYGVSGTGGESDLVLLRQRLDKLESHLDKLIDDFGRGG